MHYISMTYSESQCVASYDATQNHYLKSIELYRQTKLYNIVLYLQLSWFTITVFTTVSWFISIYSVFDYKYKGLICTFSNSAEMCGTCIAYKNWFIRLNM